MKQRFIIPILLLSALFAGCRTDETDDTPSTALYVTLAIDGSTSATVKEGATFTVTATAGNLPEDDLTITYSIAEDGDTWFDPAEGTIVIPAGSTKASSGTITAIEDDGQYYDQMTFTVSGSASDEAYTVYSCKITRNDNDTDKSDYAYDETWVYENPDAAFYSDATESLYLDCPSYSEDGVLMTKYDIDTDTDGSPHPNADLAAEGWTLLNAYEFHAIDGDNYSRTAKNDYGVCPVGVPNGWGAQSVARVVASQFVDNTKYTNVTDEGYLRLFGCTDTGTASSVGETRHMGAAACYASKWMSGGPYKAQNTPLGEGTRVEIRMRLRGDRQGYLFALWMQGNEAQINADTDKSVWPAYGEIDILENHVVKGQEELPIWNRADQTLHWGYEDSSLSNTHANPTVQTVLDNIEDWNIYWVEIVDAETLKMGVNGLTARTFTKADVTNGHGDYDWPFCNSYNPYGFHILLTMRAGYPDYEDGATDWKTSDFAALSYDDAIDSDVTPRMEIDWIRYWKNSNYDYSSMTFPVNQTVNLF